MSSTSNSPECVSSTSYSSTSVSYVARKELTLRQRVEVIDYNKKHPLISSRKLADIFGCGRSQIQSILKKKDDIIFEYETNAPASRKRHRGTHFQQVNEAVLKLYTLARQRNVPISGPMLQEEARQIAAKLGCNE